MITNANTATSIPAPSTDQDGKPHMEAAITARRTRSILSSKDGRSTDDAHGGLTSMLTPRSGWPAKAAAVATADDHRADMDMTVGSPSGAAGASKPVSPQVRARRSAIGRTSRRKTVSRFIRRTAAVLATAGAFAVAPLAPAHAAVSDSAGTLTAEASCNRYYNSMTMGASVSLSNRFPNGATVAVRYAYYNVNIYGQRTTAVQHTGWQTAFVQSSTTYVRSFDYSYGTYTYESITGQSFNMPKVSISARGTLIAMAQIGVWNGSWYEYSQWDTVGRYDNYGQFGIHNSDFVCRASAL